MVGIVDSMGELVLNLVLFKKWFEESSKGI